MKSKISICFLTIVVILLALVMIEKINTQRALAMTNIGSKINSTKDGVILDGDTVV